ncbi:hypothetical protein T265_03269 [Opisthorchis viverrini]|uniref:Innexin n=1 Tax=Opisthorchis viverrini TaxID=6198 RepID=A0A075A425_OPIVI|nr:hypothetical protein T265_03269 [Opisthorchis viverrini]KER30325.1 hypothetical protein T265_03269 [Opisthorchis viverrini]
MVAKDFIDLFAKFNYANRVAVEDFSDRINLFTVVLFLIACIIVSAKQYFLNSISCYIAVKPTGDNYNNYLTDYCWVHGTIPLRADERMPQTPSEWDEYDRIRRINVVNSLTAILFLVAGVLITVKQYVLNSISCYIPVKPTGDSYNDFLSNYCWVHGTIPLRPNEVMPQTPEVWDEYDRLRRINLGSCISSNCNVTVEVNARIYKARAAFANLRHLWRQHSSSLNLKGLVYQATVRAVLLYGCETWPIRAADLRRLQVFDNRCLGTIAHQFLDLYAKINAVNQVGLEDWADRLNLATVMLFALSAFIVGVKQYILNDISCYIPVSPSGDKFKEFLNDYCWVRGTIPLARGEVFPDSEADLDEYDKYRRITNQVGLEDWADRLNLATVMLFALSAFIVGVKQYILNDISCYIPVSPSGDKFKEFLNDYCWVRGTIPLARGEVFPDSEAIWDEYDKYRRIKFIDFYNSIAYTNRVAIEDFADQLNLFTCILFLITAILISARQYLLNAISCYIPVKPAGENFNNYLTDYCWVHGTIPLRADERTPSTEQDWDLYDATRRITYYQWVPFVLGLQCILFYIPHIAWQAVCAQRSGGDLFALVKSAAEAATSERGAREKQVKRVAEFLEDMIDGQRDCHRPSARRRLEHRAYEMCGICVVSKRLGTCLVFSYLAVKVLTIVNAILQVYLIQRFLGFYADGSSGHKSMELGKTYDSDGAGVNALQERRMDREPTKAVYSGWLRQLKNDGRVLRTPSYLITLRRALFSFPNSKGRNPRVVVVPNENENLNGFGFGLTVANHIRQGRDWPETILFPRVAYCRVPGIRLVGVENTYTAQCALPINMLNEKIYIFFWFWIMFLIGACVLSLCIWLVRMVIAPRRKDFIKRFLRIKGVLSRQGTQIGRADLDDFIDVYLRRDGVFLVRMLALNAGEVITAEIVTVLYNNYVKHIEEHEATSSVEDEKAALASKENPPSYV